jgi:O-succinylbenzoate synthase
MRTGAALAEDLHRLAVVRERFGEPESVAVDAVCGWTPEEARAFVAGAGTELLWVEDPVPYDQLDRVAGLGAPVAAGESLGSLAELRALGERGPLDCALLDVQQLGGPAAFLDSARALGAEGRRIGSHIFTAASVHLLAAVPDPLPVEVFDWSDGLFVEPPRPGPDGCLAVAGPGFGVSLDRSAVEDRGELVRP